ncbi:hypothetical protein L218DRAFT_106633 [Marasmius fiardii PR-910]|nr:hypothetical protein L218DRAFT_106633 [Marasmius fiardii PR-910]
MLNNTATYTVPNSCHTNVNPDLPSLRTFILLIYMLSLSILLFSFFIRIRSTLR